MDMSSPMNNQRLRASRPNRGVPRRLSRGANPKTFRPEVGQHMPRLHLKEEEEGGGGGGASERHRGPFWTPRLARFNVENRYRTRSRRF